jgi:hypothetical protein
METPQIPQLAPSSPNTSFWQFSSNKYIDATKEFLDSNSLVAKIAFLLFALFLYVMLFRVGMMIIMYFYGPKDMQKILHGMINANNPIRIRQDPREDGSNTVLRSNNERSGIEFTWSVWLYIDQTTLNQNTNKYMHIFHKGNSNFITSGNNNGLNSPNNGPGLYISPYDNASHSVKLTCIMSTFEDPMEKVEIQNVPLDKWVNIIIRCKNTHIDVYVNGIVATSIKLTGVPKQNFGDVFVCQNGGFIGNISDLWYYKYALGAGEIQRLMRNGPSLFAASAGNISNNIANTNYLSLQWYFDGINTMFN